MNLTTLLRKACSNSPFRSEWRRSKDELLRYEAIRRMCRAQEQFIQGRKDDEGEVPYG